MVTLLGDKARMGEPVDILTSVLSHHGREYKIKKARAGRMSRPMKISAISCGQISIQKERSR